MMRDDPFLRPEDLAELQAQLQEQLQEQQHRKRRASAILVHLNALKCSTALPSKPQGDQDAAERGSERD